MCRIWTQQKRLVLPWSWFCVRNQAKEHWSFRPLTTCILYCPSAPHSLPHTLKFAYGTPSVSLGQALCLQGNHLLLNSKGCPYFLGGMWCLCAGIRTQHQIAEYSQQAQRSHRMIHGHTRKAGLSDPEKTSTCCVSHRNCITFFLEKCHSQTSQAKSLGKQERNHWVLQAQMLNLQCRTFST